jgi:hypothetical protein
MNILIVVILLILSYCLFIKYQIDKAIKNRFNEIESIKEYLNLVNDEYDKFLVKVIKLSDVYYNSELDDDPNVFGESWDIRFDCEVFGKSIDILAATCYFYPDKQYKNKLEYVWQNQKDSQGRNFLERLVKRLMRISLKKLLKKKLHA